MSDEPDRLTNPEREYRDGDGGMHPDRRRPDFWQDALHDHMDDPWAHGRAISRLTSESPLRGEIDKLTRGLDNANIERAELRGWLRGIGIALSVLSLLVSAFGGTTLYLIVSGHH